MNLQRRGAAQDHTDRTARPFGVVAEVAHQVFIAVGDMVHQESQPFDGRHQLVVAFQCGVRFGSLMPGFGQVLGEKDRLAIIACFQGLWNDNIYQRFQEIDARSKE